MPEEMLNGFLRLAHEKAYAAEQQGIYWAFGIVLFNGVPWQIGLKCWEKS